MLAANNQAVNPVASNHVFHEQTLRKSGKRCNCYSTSLQELKSLIYLLNLCAIHILDLLC